MATNNPFKIENLTQSKTINNFGFDLVYLSVQEANRMTVMVETDEDFAFGDEIEFYQNSTGYFRGSVENITTDEENNWEITIIGADGGIRKERINRTFQNIGIEQAIKNAVEDNTSFTVQINFTSGQTFDDKTYDDPLGTLFQDLIDNTRVQIRVDTFNKTIFLEEEGGLDNSRTLNTTGSNANFKITDYEEDGSNVIDTLKIKGSPQSKQITGESFSPSSGQTVITLSKPSDQVETIDEVRVDGSKQIKSFSVEESADFRVQIADDGRPTNQLTFNEAFSGSESVEVDYTFVKEPFAVVTVTNADGEGYAKKKIPSVTSKEEAQKAGERIISKLKKTELAITGNYVNDANRKLDLDVKAGEEVTLNAEEKGISGRTINIVKVTHSFPGGTTMELGRPENYSLQKEKDQERRQGSEEDESFSSLADQLKEKGLRESQEFTHVDGWHINNVNNSAKQQFVVFIPDKESLRYLEMDLYRPQLTYDQSGGSISDSFEKVLSTGLTEDRFGVPYDGDTDNGHTNGLSEVTTPSAIGDVVDMGSDASFNSGVQQGDTISTSVSFFGSDPNGLGNVSEIYWNLTGDVNSSQEWAVRILVDSAVVREYTIRAGSQRIFQRFPLMENLDGKNAEIFLARADSGSAADVSLVIGGNTVAKHSHTIYSGGDSTQSDTADITYSPNSDQLDTDASSEDNQGDNTHDDPEHDIDFSPDDPSTVVASDSGGEDVFVDVTPFSTGTTSNIGAVSNFSQGDTVNLRFQKSDFETGFNLVEVYNDTTTDIKMASLFRKALSRVR